MIKNLYDSASMDDMTRKELIAFTSRSLRLRGFRAVRMDAIAREMKISKRTLYEMYDTKDNLINHCLRSYADRTKNRFAIIKCRVPDPLEYLFDISRQYVDHLYKAECIFWQDLTVYYPHFYRAIRQIWDDELEESLLACKGRSWVRADVDICAFLHAFARISYSARVTGWPADLLHQSASCMLRGILTIPGILKADAPAPAR